MRNNEAEKLLAPAIGVARAILADTKGCIQQEFNGAIASFGSTILISGALPACALYLKTTGSSKSEKENLIACLLYLIEKQNNPGHNTDYKREGELAPKANLIHTVVAYHTANESKFRHQLIVATNALKLAMSTFKFVETEKLTS